MWFFKKKKKTEPVAQDPIIEDEWDEEDDWDLEDEEDWDDYEGAELVEAPGDVSMVHIDPANIDPGVESPAYILTPSGNMTIRWQGRTHSVGRDHAFYKEIIAALDSEDYTDLGDYLDVPSAFENVVPGVAVNQYGEVFYNGCPVHNQIADRIGEFIRAGLPFKPLARFLANLMENPSERSRKELYTFLEHGNFPITEDGCFVAYKGVTSDFKDCYSKTFDNRVGQTHSMPRENVDDNASSACSTGFHVGTYAYADSFRSYNGRLVLVKVNPRDAVSVPYDHSHEKLRVCSYEVVEICQDILSEPLFVAQAARSKPQGNLVFDDGMGRWRDMDAGGRVVSRSHAEALGYEVAQKI